MLLLPVAIGLYQRVFSQGLIITNGGHLVLKDTAKIIINNGGFSNSGNFNAGNGSVSFTGAGSGNISGTSTSTFNNIVIDKGDDTLRLLQHANILGRVKLSHGNVDLNGYNIDLGETGTLSGETARSRVLGPGGGFLISTTNIYASGGTVNPGNLGMVFTPSYDLGYTLIKRGHQEPELTNGFGINRFYDVTAANGTAANDAVTFQYFDDELNGVTESELGVYYIPSANGGEILKTITAFDSAGNFISVNNAGFAGRYVLAGVISDSIRGTALQAALVADKVNLSWATAYEVSTDHFELQRSLDNVNFSTLESLAAAGNSNVKRDYGYTDPEPMLTANEGAGLRYYRYKIVFKDKTYRYSNVAIVAPEGYNYSIFQVYPNPTSGPMVVNFSINREQKVYVEIVNNMGVVIARKAVNTIIGMNSLSFDLGQMMSGVYYVRVVNVFKTAYKIIKL